MSLQRHHRDVLVWLTRHADELQLSVEARKHVQWFLYYFDHDCDEQKTCEAFDIHVSTLRRWMKKFDPSDHSSLVSKSRRPHTKRKSKIGRGTVEIIRQYRMRWPHINREMLSDLLWAKHDVALSPSSIGRIIKDNKLFFASSPSHKEKRSPGFIYPEEEAPTQKPENEDNMFFDDDYPDFAIS